MFMQEFKKEVSNYIQKNKFNEALDVVNQEISKDSKNIDLYIMRGDLYYRMQKFADALNDYNKVLKVDKTNKSISSKVELIKGILKFEALDIYASTNLNNDPWLD